MNILIYSILAMSLYDINMCNSLVYNHHATGHSVGAEVPRNIYIIAISLEETPSYFLLLHLLQHHLLSIESCW